jgi:hypothetical protein
MTTATKQIKFDNTDLESQIHISNITGDKEKTCINIVTPPDGQGGFGDLTANIYMARQLYELGMKVNLFIDNSFRSKLLTLLPQIPLYLVKPSDSKTAVSIGGIGCFENIFYYLIPDSQMVPVLTAEGEVTEDKLSKYLPPPSNETKYVSFASKSLGSSYGKGLSRKNHLIDELLKTNRSAALIFGEYTDSKNVIFWKNRGIEATRFHPGPSTLGLYISPKKPTLKIDRSALLHQYFPQLPFNVNCNTANLSFCYTTSSGMSELYLEALSIWARENPNEQFFLISKYAAPPSLSLPANLHISHQEKIPFKETENIIAASTIPVMITGDMSLTLALQHEKLFFYEQLDHKFPIDKELSYYPALKELPSLSYEVASLGMGVDCACIPKINHASYLQKLKNGFQWHQEHPDYFAHGFGKIRGKLSLPLRFSQILEFATKTKNPYNDIEKLHLLKGSEVRKQILQDWIAAYKVEASFQSNLTMLQEYRRGDLLISLQNLGIEFDLIWADEDLKKGYEENFQSDLKLRRAEMIEFFNNAKDRVSLKLRHTKNDS